MVGNGLKPEVWAPFIERFKIPNIGEFYGATEVRSIDRSIERASPLSINLH